MKTIWRTAALSAVLSAFLPLSSGSVHAENLTYSGLSSRIQALERELSSQQVQLASCDSSDSCCGGGGSACCAPAACSAWYVSYELTALRPIVSERGVGLPFEDDYGFGHRMVLGYDGGSGMGVRMRYWFYDQSHDLTNPFNGTVGIDMDVLDIEITLQEQLRNWNLLVSGGFRYGRMGFSHFILGADEVFFEGTGPTVSLEAVRGFGDQGLYFLGNFRGSLLYGDTNFGGDFEDDIVTVLENQLGVGYTRNLGGAILTLRTVWETQFWLSDTLVSSPLDGSVGFAGPSSTIELRF